MKRLLYSVSTETQSIWEYYRNPNTEFGKHLITGFPCGSSGKESACSAGDLSSIPGLGRPPGEGKGYHSSILAWIIPQTIQSKGLQRVRHD